MFLSREQLPELFVRWVVKLPADTSDVKVVPHFGWAVTPVYSIVFHLSPRFSTESSIINYRAPVGFDFTSPQMAEPIRTRGNFEQFEYHGAFRFNLMTGAIQPYVKYGHGITWYRLEDVSVDGVPLSDPTSPKFRPAGSWQNFGFNEMIVGGGVDWSQLRIGQDVARRESQLHVDSPQPRVREERRRRELPDDCHRARRHDVFHLAPAGPRADQHRVLATGGDCESCNDCPLRRRHRGGRGRA